MHQYQKLALSLLKVYLTYFLKVYLGRDSYNFLGEEMIDRFLKILRYFKVVLYRPLTHMHFYATIKLALSITSTIVSNLVQCFL